jgi:putative spermidine/putrescine transport system permease protein
MTLPRIAVWVLLIPAFLAIAFLFTAYGDFAWISLFRSSGGGLSVSGSPSLDNYWRILGSSRELAILGETLWVSAELTGLTLLLGLPIAIAVARSRSRAFRTVIVFALAVTFLSGGVTRAYAWLVLLGSRGLFNTWLQQAGVISAPIPLVNNWNGVLIALVHFLLPFFVFTLVGAVKNVPVAVEEAARNLGASRARTFLFVTLPILLPGIVGAASLTYSLALSSFLFPMLLGGGRVRMVANYIYERIFVTSDVPFAAATSVVFLVVAIAVIAAFSGLERLLRRGRAA